jgi:hypothetical protein
MRETPKTPAQQTKTGNNTKQTQATTKNSINSIGKQYFDEQTVCDELL